MGKPIIEVQNLSKRYHLGRVGATTLREDLGRHVQRLRGRSAYASESEFWALRDVSFSVQPGEVLGVIGRNGAGKSTLLKILSRITEPTSGRAVLRGRVASLLEVGTGFHPDLTGRENVFLNGAILGMKTAQVFARFDEIVAFAEIAKFIDTPVKHYSSGMRVRLAFAVAAHLDSEILIADEVLAVGDAAFQARCLNKMQDINRSGRAVIFVSHQMASVRSLCDRTVWMQQGQVRDQGPTREVIDRYLFTNRPNDPTRVNFGPSDEAESFAVETLIINDGARILHGEPLTAEIHFRASQAVAELSAGIGFSSLDGTKLLTLDSDVSNARPSTPGPVTGRICIRLDALPLAPGVYTVDVGARSGDQKSLWYRRECTTIEVFAGASTPNCILRPSAGVCIPTRASWDWSEVA